MAEADAARSLHPGVVSDSLDVETLIADRAQVADELRGRETNLERLRLAAFRHTLARLQLRDDGLAEQLNAYYLARRFEHVELYSDVLTTLTSLRSSYLLGLLSNGNGYRRTQWARRHVLDSRLLPGPRGREARHRAFRHCRSRRQMLA